MTRTFRQGSSKDIWTELDDTGKPVEVFFEFSERVSVFDEGPLPIKFENLGRLRCAIAGRIFQALNSAGFNTHYVSHDAASARMYVKPVNIPAFIPPVDYGEAAVGTMLPVEFLCRRMLTKKFMGRIERGEVDRVVIEKLMVFPEFREGATLDPPFVECSTKYEAADRYITDAEAAKLVGRDEISLTNDCYSIVEDIFGFLYNFFRSEGGFLLRDGKIEMAVAFDGSIMLVDSISPDELGLIDPQGRLADKNIIRSYMIEHYPEWYADLEAAKKLYPNDKSMWPEYPSDLKLPKELVDDYIEKTRQVAEAIGAI